MFVALGVIAVLASVLMAGLAWRWTGGNWAIIATPSMGHAVPVGTLIFTRDEPLRRVAVGDVVSYHPANAPEQLITHRVVGLREDGSLTVRGDLNGAADPVPVRQKDLVGTVVAQWYGVGWLVRALPFLIVGSMVILIGSEAFVRSRWRSSVRIMASCLLVSISALILRPFVRPVLRGVSDASGRPVAEVVSTGLLPTRVSGAPSHFVDLVNGQVGTVPVQPVPAGEAFRITGNPQLDATWTLAVVGVCALPLLWCLVVGLAPDEDPR